MNNNNNNRFFNSLYWLNVSLYQLFSRLIPDNKIRVITNSLDKTEIIDENNNQLFILDNSDIISIYYSKLDVTDTFDKTIKDFEIVIYKILEYYIDKDIIQKYSDFINEQFMDTIKFNYLDNIINECKDVFKDYDIILGGIYIRNCIDLFNIYPKDEQTPGPILSFYKYPDEDCIRVEQFKDRAEYFPRMFSSINNKANDYNEMIDENLIQEYIFNWLINCVI